MLTCSIAHPVGNPNWLVATVGEIVRTTNVPQNQSYVVDGSEFKCSDSII